ncbi:cation H(+) antiporter 20 [Olea europaea subsp. europaea]|uniref:Cation H(+) antiporter 20 n=1 Tax=Olea europaea subsp. europaea TaxID=158383 RepID=A0A8S0PT46_OLEEU|nr:cation H(+) antiporter 20 [Olea europaea subsp. europaea]
MAFNASSIKTSSDGIWQGENPLQYAFPLLIIQTTLVILMSRAVAFFLKPLRQPKVVAEIVGGIILGPSALGRNKDFTHWVFPSWSTPILESVASMGLLFFLFLVGLELDLNAIRRSGKKALGIAVAGISLPFIFGIGVTFLLRKAIKMSDRIGYAEYFVFIGVSLSITAFPVLARILAELKLLTTRVGETAMAAAALNDVVAWILLALAVALAGGAHSPLVSIWVLLSGLAFIGFMIVVVRPVMNWVAIKCSSDHNIVDEGYICLTLAAVMVSGFLTDLIGIHAIFGAFIFGLIIPKRGELAGRLIKRIEDFVFGLLLPLYFASNGLKTDVGKIQGAAAWGVLAVVISSACAGKILGTFMVALLCTIPVRESLALGLLMNTKGLVELVVLNIGREKKVLNDEMFAILVMMALFTTFMTTPTVMAIYKPEHKLPAIGGCEFWKKLSNSKGTDAELRILACIRGPGNSPSLINLIKSSRSTRRFITKLYVMQLVELTDRSSSIVMVQRARKNGIPCIGRFHQGEFSEQRAAAFEAYNQLGRVTVRPTIAISTLSIMHEDICHIAEKKRAAMIILPFHKQWKIDGDQDVEINVGHGWRDVNEKVLINAPCSVGVLIDRGFGLGVQRSPRDGDLLKRVCVVFFGGPDSRKVLKFGGRMVDNPEVRLTVIKFVANAGSDGNIKTQSTSLEVSVELDNNSTASMNYRKEMHDEAVLADFRGSCNGIAEYIEKETENIAEDVLAIAQSSEFELIVVGKGRFPPAMVAELDNHHNAYNELGPIGGLLASSGNGIKCSVLVIQHHDSTHDDKSLNLKMFNKKDGSVDKCVTNL